MWEINRFSDGKTMISVTGDEFLHILPSEVDELIEEYNDTCSDEKQKTNVESYFTDKSIFTFNIPQDRIVLKDRKEKGTNDYKKEV